MRVNTPQASQRAAGGGVIPSKGPRGLRGCGAGVRSFRVGVRAFGVRIQVFGAGVQGFGVGGSRLWRRDSKCWGWGSRFRGWGSRFRMRMMQGSGSQLRGFRTGLRGFGPKSSKPKPPTFAEGQPQTPEPPEGRLKENPGARPPDREQICKIRWF